ncbi:hypothetical protein B0H13DRAFT_1493268, partial [Mycena leptocephala]
SANSEALPSGWQRRHTPAGRAYFVDHNTKTTSWTAPVRTASDSSANSEALPSGWERRHAPAGRAYFVDHNTETTSWMAP